MSISGKIFGYSVLSGLYITKTKTNKKLWFSSVTHSCLTLCDPTDCSTPGFPVHHQLPELAQTHIRGVSVAIQPSHHVFPFSSCLQSFPAAGSFLMSQLLPSGAQNFGASASVLPMNIQDWLPLGLTGWLSLQFKGLSRVFSNTTVNFNLLLFYWWTFNQ